MSKYVGPEFLKSYKESRVKNIEIFQKEDLFENYESVLMNIMKNCYNFSLYIVNYNGSIYQIQKK